MAYYLFRMRFGPGGDDIAPQVWGTEHVGIWQGVWTAENPPPAETQTAPVRQFLSLIPEEDWALTIFGARMHCGRVAGPVENAPPDFTRGGEPFKWRAVSAPPGLSRCQPSQTPSGSSRPPDGERCSG